MKIDITEMLIIFDEQLPATKEELGIYWFKAVRPDGIYIIFAFSLFEEYVDIIIHASKEIVAAGINLENCSEIRVLDEKRKCLEILHKDKSKGRCFLSLMGEVIVEYSESTN